MAIWILVLFTVTVLLVAYQAIFLPAIHSLLRSAVLSERAKIISLIESGKLSADDAALKMLLVSFKGTYEAIPEIDFSLLYTISKQATSASAEKRIIRGIKQISEHPLKQLSKSHTKLLLIFNGAFILNSIIAIVLCLPVVMVIRRFRKDGETGGQHRNLPKSSSIPLPANDLEPLRVNYGV